MEHRAHVKASPNVEVTDAARLYRAASVTFIALSGDSAPHFTTFGDFVSTLGDETARLFAQVLTLCDRQGLIGREMFAIDGVKLPSNASKGKSGRRADFIKQAEKMEALLHCAQH